MTPNRARGFVKLFSMFFSLVSYHLIYSRLSAIMIIREAELLNILEIAEMISEVSTGALERSRTIPMRKTKIIPTAARSHCICGEFGAISLRSAVSLERNIRVMPRMVHPRSSVVIMVATALAAGLVPIRGCRSSAPKCPSIYPNTFAKITQDAANSMLIHLFMHMIRIMLIVRTVSRSSSFSPAYLHTSATAA